MADEYNTPVSAVCADPTDTNNPDCSADAVSTLATRGQSFLLRMEAPCFNGKRKWRYHTEDPPGLNRADNHMQGLQCKDDVMLLTAGDWNEPAAHLFIAKLDRVDGSPVGGVISRIVCIDCDRPHAGGIQRLGNLLAIPLEQKSGSSAVKFLDIRDPENPAIVGGKADFIRENPKASATGLARMPDGRILLGVAWADFIDLYLSADQDVRNGWLPANSAPACVSLDLSGVADENPAYQSLTFLSPRIDPTTGAVIVPTVGTRNTRQSLSNWWKGSDFADVFELFVSADCLTDWGNAGEVRAVSARPPIRFETGRADGNFSAAVGIEILGVDHCLLYAAHHWRTDKGIRVTVYRRS